MDKLVQYIFYNDSLLFTKEELAKHVALGQNSISSICTFRTKVGQTVPYYTDWSYEMTEIEVLSVSEETLLKISKMKYDEGNGWVNFDTGLVTYKNQGKEIAVVVLPPLDETTRNKYLCFLFE